MTGSLEARGHYLELDGLPQTAEPIVSYFWNERGNLRNFRDTVVIRNALSADETDLLGEQLAPIGLNHELPDEIGGESISQAYRLIWQGNNQIGARTDCIQFFFGTGGLPAHIDFMYRRNEVTAHKIKSLVFSIGAVGSATLGFNPRQPSWHTEPSEGQLYAGGSGGYSPPIEEMRTVVEQNPGDLIVIRPGIVHMVLADDQRRSLLITQDNKLD